jgi:hypothetical protein
VWPKTGRENSSVSSGDADSREHVPRQPFVITFDAGDITGADEALVDALTRLHLAARRMGVTIELRNARRELVDLLRLIGLAAVLGVEMDGQVEQREQAGIDEEVDRGDHAV